ncbi:hypothetical protein MSG28_004359, partial [Choristoneura fumiferana]
MCSNADFLWSPIESNCIVLYCILVSVIATAHNITFLEVPSYGDPRRNVDLTCHYINDKGNPPLHSVKWYRNNNEIFRYMPGQQPETRTFNTTAGGVTRGDCNKHSCSISVVLPKKYNTRISYMCEVSTEGPRFAVVKQTKNLTVAVALNQDPVITGLPSSVSFGEDVLVNCTTAPAMPPANIFEPWVVDNTEVTEADSDGLRRSWRPLKIKITSGRFVSLRCEAMQPTHPPYMRSTNASLTVARSPHLGMFTASGYISSLSYSMICGPLKIKVMSGRFVSFRCEATQATHPPY